MKLKVYILTSKFKQSAVYYLTVERYKYFFDKKSTINKFIIYTK